MAAVNDLLVDAFTRVRDVLYGVLDGLTEDQLRWRAGPDANSIGWLSWHVTRIQDDHVAHVAGTEQRWHADGWEQRFGLPYPPMEIGYGQTSEDVAAFRASAELLRGYHDAVHAATTSYVATLGEDDFPRVVDTRWDPPVTLSVRLVSVVNDNMQHVGQAAFVRGLLEAQQPPAVPGSG